MGRPLSPPSVRLPESRQAVDRLARRVLWPVGLGMVVIGELGFFIHHLTPRETFPLDLSVSTASIVAGLLVWQRQPANNTGRLLVAAGMLWAIPGVRSFLNPVAFGIGEWIDGLQDIVFAHLLIAYPAGRLATRTQRVVMAAGYSVVLWRLIGVLVLDPGTCRCYPVHNGFQVWDNQPLHDALVHLDDAIGAVLVVVGIGMLARRWWRASPAGRQVYSPVLAAGLFFAAASGADLLTGDTDWAFFTVLVARICIPLAFAYGLLRGHLARSAVGDLVVRIGGNRDGAGRGSLHESLATALHDPSVELLFWVPDRAGFVDRDGRDATLPRDRSDRAVTMVEFDDTPLGAIVHDPAVLDNPELVRGAAAAARLALFNARLQAEVRAQLEQVRASRTRIVEAGDAERRRVERDLHDGAQQRLLALALSLQIAVDRVPDDPDLQSVLRQARDDARAAVVELRDLARGIHPAILSEAGLAAAVEDLAERTTLPVRVDATPGRFPQSIEVAAYYVIAEALSNIVKHAAASRVDIAVGATEHELYVEVRDDGVGGARPVGGGGLAGLDDRIAAVGGRLQVCSPVGDGTAICARIPLS